MAEPAFNLSAWEGEARRSLEVQSYHGLQIKPEASQGYILKPVSKQQY